MGCVITASVMSQLNQFAHHYTVSVSLLREEAPSSSNHREMTYSSALLYRSYYEEKSLHHWLAATFLCTELERECDGRIMNSLLAWIIVG